MRAKITMTSHPSVYVTYTAQYDNSSVSVDTLSCGSVLSADGYATYGSIPRYPYVAGYYGGNSTCGQCYSLNYESTYLTVQVIDYYGGGFALPTEAYAWLTTGSTEGPITTEGVTAYLADGPFNCN